MISNGTKRDRNLPDRRKPSSGVFHYKDQPTIVYLTICTKNRKPWLAQQVAQDAVTGVWKRATAWSVGFYLLMPDHVHLFCAPHDLEIPLTDWIRYWKSMFKRETSDRSWLWQSGKWDTLLRYGESYQNKWEYVRCNPVRKGLVVSPDDWPYQGVMNELRW